MELLEWAKIITLGIVEGITEFLPISSTGHLIVASDLLGFKGALDGTFEIFIQLGAVVAVIGYYWRDLMHQVRTVRTERDTQRLWLGIIVASIPAAVLGLLLHDWITDVLFSPTVVAISLISGGIVFIVVERRIVDDTEAERTDDLYAVSWQQALTVGLMQTLALIPGVSRSGASIFGGLFSGLSRATATTFSFYLSMPVLGGATILSLLLDLENVSAGDVVNLALGTVVSGIVAWFAIDWLLKYIAHHNFITFGWYRIVAGCGILLLVAAQVI